MLLGGEIEKKTLERKTEEQAVRDFFRGGSLLSYWEEAKSGRRVFQRREGRQRKEERFSGTFIVDSLLVSIGMFFCSVSVDP